MKKKILGFISGILITIILFASVPALAQNLDVALNTINITLDGETMATAGKGYNMSDGTEMPYSLNLNGTVYLPLRQMATLLNVDIQWDSETNTAILTSDNDNSNNETIDNNTNNSTNETSKTSDDYSNWTAEEKAAYQEFKDMWDVESWKVPPEDLKMSAKYTGKLSKEEMTALLKSNEKNINQLFNEVASEYLKNNTDFNSLFTLAFFYDDIIWQNKSAYAVASINNEHTNYTPFIIYK